MLTLDFKSSAHLGDSVQRAEEDFSRQILSCADGICAKDNLKILALSGPTCSGKTTTAARLTCELDKRGRRTRIISIDDFYLDRDSLDRSATDYESFEALDSGYLKQCVDGILSGKGALLPRYDFISGKRAGYSECTVGNDDIYIFEGIQALYPQVTAMFSGYSESLFVSVMDDAVINGVFFDKTELRLIRRLLRDYLSRGATADFTLTLWDNVRENEEKNIFPYAENCDFYISSYLPYETPILAAPLMKILSEVETESENHPMASHLAAKLSLLLPVSADRAIIPAGSILNEFTETVK